jgi:hypothetical protein
MLYFNRELKSGKYWRISKEGIKSYHHVLYDIKNNIFFKITHINFNSKEENFKTNILCKVQYGKYIYIYIVDIYDKNNFIKPTKYKIINLSNDEINYYFCNYIKLNREILIRENNIIVIKSINFERVVVSYIYNKQLLNLFNLYLDDGRFINVK